MDKRQYQIILQITLFPWVWVIRWKNEAIRKLGKSLGAHSAYIFRYHQSLWDRCPMDHLNWCHSQMSLRQTIILCPARPPTTPERRPAAISCGDKYFSNQLLSLSLSSSWWICWSCGSPRPRLQANIRFALVYFHLFPLCNCSTDLCRANIVLDRIYYWIIDRAYISLHLFK